jgi:guanylate kinase
MNKIIILTAPSGAGKTIYQAFIEKIPGSFHFHFCRHKKPRGAEKNG